MANVISIDQAVRNTAIPRRIDIVREVIPETGFWLPFNDVSKVRISQGYFGAYSHYATESGPSNILNDDSYSVDFKLAYGTPVLAAKKGIVYAVMMNNDSFYEGFNPQIGLKIPANYIIIMHDNGLCSLYSHLRKGSQTVKRGQEVQQGQVIGYTGRSGWIAKIPHLHFEVCELGLRKMQDMVVGRISSPVIFDNYKGTQDDRMLQIVRYKSRLVG